MERRDVSPYNIPLELAVITAEQSIYHYKCHTPRPSVCCHPFLPRELSLIISGSSRPVLSPADKRGSAVAGCRILCNRLLPAQLQPGDVGRKVAGRCNDVRCAMSACSGVCGKRCNVYVREQTKLPLQYRSGTRLANKLSTNCTSGIASCSAVPPVATTCPHLPPTRSVG